MTISKPVQYCLLAILGLGGIGLVLMFYVAFTHEKCKALRAAFASPWPGTSYSSSCSSADQSLLKAHHYDFAAAWKQCGQQSWGDANQADNCLQSRFASLSSSCTRCFGDFVGCTKANCWWPCGIQGADSQECKDCSLQHCQTNLISCTGLQQNELPSVTP